MSTRGTWSRDVESKLDRAGLTQPGKDWLLMALDPFPDMEHDIVGMPDGQAGRSIVQQYNQTITIGHPPALADGATWDFHAAFIPELMDPTLNSAMHAHVANCFNGTCFQLTGANSFLITNPATGTNAFPWRAPLSMVSVPTGNATFPNGDNANPWGAATCALDGFDLTGYVGPQSRLIGGGFEVENTTEALYRSGGVSYYTTPNECATSCAAVIDGSTGTNIPGIRTIKVSRCPPTTLAQCMSIPGSVRRKAEEGAYIPFRFSKGQVNPPVEPVFDCSVYSASPINSVQDNTTSSGGFATATLDWTTIAAFTPIPGLPLSQRVPFDTSGAYFTGLSKQTTLDVTLRLFIEVFPTAATQVLVSTTRPAPPDDPVACELYSQVSRQLPPGVEVKFNANGGWFKNLMKTISSVAPTIGNALGTVVPGAGLIGSGVGKIADMLSGIRLGEKAQKEVDQRRSGQAKRLEKSDFGKAQRDAGLQMVRRSPATSGRIASSSRKKFAKSSNPLPGKNKKTLARAKALIAEMD